MKRFVFAVCAMMSSTGWAHACEASKAVYENTKDKAFTISFSKQKNPKSWSDILATLKTPHRKLEFEFTASNGYEVQFMVLLTKGLKQDREVEIEFFSKDLKSLQLPQAGETAAEYIFSRQLGLWLWYSGASPREYIPPAMWKLKACKS